VGNAVIGFKPVNNIPSWGGSVGRVDILFELQLRAYNELGSSSSQFRKIQI
jgi:hypothetical protein